ncbi:MAG: SDR family NAD(P)-dependent oxidoreductase [Sandaracinaceae bacterium]|nr:SDR family NAD(P)-dependent oxidoreductase [Sandaracinaceae bacterium]
MQSHWNDADAPSDPLELRAYTSRLLGADPSLVLHGGGNTSVKLTVSDFFGDPVDVLYVKGSGWDLASIQPAGFAPVRLAVLRKMAELAELSDSDMVREQRAAMLDPSAPNPSVEAILHAVLPHRFVDHTHADAVVTLSNAPDGERRIRELYGDRVIVVPYVMPGFVLARKVWEMTREIRDWSRLEGMVLLHHGVFSFADDARESYERMIRLVGMAEDALKERGALGAPRVAEAGEADPAALAELRRAVSRAAGRAVVARFDGSPEARGFASREDAGELATRGPVTPDHVIRMKRTPVFVEDDAGAVDRYAEAYRAYFARHDDGTLKCLDPAPRWAIWAGRGAVAFGASAKAADEVIDIARSSVRCFQWGEALGGWRPLGERELFEMEYWELEQKKLAKPGAPPPLAGKVALVTGGATGIGRATASALRAAGAAVCVLDVRPEIEERRAADVLPIVCDVTDARAVGAAVESCVRTFGGLDVLVTNAGNFPPSQAIEAIDEATWRHTLELNASSHARHARGGALLGARDRSGHRGHRLAQRARAGAGRGGLLREQGGADPARARRRAGARAARRARERAPPGQGLRHRALERREDRASREELRPERRAVQEEQPPRRRGDHGRRGGPRRGHGGPALPHHDRRAGPGGRRQRPRHLTPPFAPFHGWLAGSDAGAGSASGSEAGAGCSPGVARVA